MYYEDNAIGWFLFVNDLNETFTTPNQQKIRLMDKFYTDVANGNLPEYSFITPRWTVDKT